MTATLKAQRGRGGGGLGPEETLITDTLTHGGHPNSNTPGRRREDDTNIVPMAFAENSRAELVESDVHQALTRPGGKPGQNMPAVRVGMGVRRLTPRECERLQGFPDDWTLIDGASDSKRYAALGNAVTVNVVEWIARRLVSVNTRSGGGS